MELDSIFAFIAAFVSFCALMISLQMYKTSKRQADAAKKQAEAADIQVKLAKDSADITQKNTKSQLFITLRSKYLEVHSKLPVDDHFEYQEYKKELRSYWVNAFNEWYITSEIFPKYKLWDEFYEYTIKKALNNPVFLRSLEDILTSMHGQFSLGPECLQDKFLKAIGFDELKKQTSVSHHP